MRARELRPRRPWLLPGLRLWVVGGARVPSATATALSAISSDVRVTSRTALRVALGSAAVLSPAEAAALLPGRDQDELRWLRAQGLVRERVLPDQRLTEYVLWREVEAALGATRSPEPTPQATVGGLRRRSAQ
jgi:hypothetical protein